MTLTAPSQTTLPTPVARNARLTLPRVINSEMIKLLSLRSTWWSAALLVAASAGVAMLVGLSADGSVSSGTDIVIRATTSGSVLTVLMATILGAMSVTGEYSTGMARSTFTASPDRTRPFIAKAVVLAVFMFVLSMLTSVVCALFASAFVMPNGINIDAADPTALFAVLRNATYFALIAALGVGVGFLVRSGAGAIAILVGLIFVAPVVLSVLSAYPSLHWLADVITILPGGAGQTFIVGDPAQLAQSSMTLVAWALGGLLCGYVALRMRDV